jgi:hypothetical protein
MMARENILLKMGMNYFYFWFQEKRRSVVVLNDEKRAERRVTALGVGLIKFRVIPSENNTQRGISRVLPLSSTPHPLTQISGWVSDPCIKQYFRSLDEVCNN